METQTQTPNRTEPMETQTQTLRLARWSGDRFDRFLALGDAWAFVVIPNGASTAYVRTPDETDRMPDGSPVLDALGEYVAETPHGRPAVVVEAFGVAYRGVAAHLGYSHDGDGWAVSSLYAGRNDRAFGGDPTDAARRRLGEYIVEAVRRVRWAFPTAWAEGGVEACRYETESRAVDVRRAVETLAETLDALDESRRAYAEAAGATPPEPTARPVFEQGEHGEPYALRLALDGARVGVEIGLAGFLRLAVEAEERRRVGLAPFDVLRVEGQAVEADDVLDALFGKGQA